MNSLPYQLDKMAKTLATRYLQTEGELLSVLMEMRRRRAFATLNYSGIFDYCERALRFSRAQAYYFKSVAEKAEEVPEIKRAIDQGELTLSEARRIVPAVTKTNAREWIEKARALPQVELERAVTEFNPRAYKRDRITAFSPEVSELRASVDRETRENIRALQDLLSQKTRKAASVSDVVRWATRTCREKYDPLLKKAAAPRPAQPGTTGRLPRPSPAEGNTNRRHAESTRSPLDQADNPGSRPNAGFAADLHSHSVSSGNRRIPIRQSLRAAVIQRDSRQCTFIGHDGLRCRQQRWLHLHHVREVSQGGENSAENLTTLCQAHHRLKHLRREKPARS